MSVVFCEILSLITIAGILWLSLVNHSFEGGWSMLFVFLVFLPLCFFLMGMGTSRMQHEIKELRKQIEELRQQNNPEVH
jgi:hypothetical protein